MYMNLKPNKHKRIYFNTTTMTQVPPHPPPPPPQLFWSEILSPAPPPPKIRGELLPWLHHTFSKS